jgi:CAAX prenyl protease-like protein
LETSDVRKGTQLLGPAAARALPFGIYICILVVESLLPRDAVALDPRWLYAVKVAAVTAALAMLWGRYTELRSAPRVGPAGWLISVVVGCAVFVLWITATYPWAVMGTPGGWSAADASGAIDWWLVAVRLAGAALVVPVMEELFWRSLVMRWIRNPSFLNVAPEHAGAMAVVVSSVLFGLEHHQWFSGIVAGLAYAGTYVRTRNLWCAILAHAVTNLLLGIWVVYTRQWQFW